MFTRVLRAVVVVVEAQGESPIAIQPSKEMNCRQKLLSELLCPYFLGLLYVEVSKN